jgi:hyperosmotically inducible periplasmic protein
MRAKNDCTDSLDLYVSSGAEPPLFMGDVLSKRPATVKVKRSPRFRKELYLMTPMIRVAAALVVFFALTGCQAMTGRTAGRNIDDLTITTSVKARLVADKLSNFTRIDVDTVNAVVSLNGLVESEDEKRRAEDIASLVDGVKQIVNDLQVQKEPAPKSE